MINDIGENIVECKSCGSRFEISERWVQVRLILPIIVQIYFIPGKIDCFILPAKKLTNMSHLVFRLALTRDKVNSWGNF